MGRRRHRSRGRCRNCCFHSWTQKTGSGWGFWARPTRDGAWGPAGAFPEGSGAAAALTTARLGQRGTGGCGGQPVPAPTRLLCVCALSTLSLVVFFAASCFEEGHGLVVLVRRDRERLGCFTVPAARVLLVGPAGQTRQSPRGRPAANLACTGRGRPAGRGLASGGSRGSCCAAPCLPG